MKVMMNKKLFIQSFLLVFICVLIVATVAISPVVSQDATQVPFETAVYIAGQTLAAEATGTAYAMEVNTSITSTALPNAVLTPNFDISITQNSDWTAMTQTIGGVPMVFVPPGCFQMGSREDDPEAKPEEQPEHTVCITQGYWLDQYEVTNEEFGKFINAGGYQNEQYWTEEGWTWLQEAPNDASTPHDYGGYTGTFQPRVGISWYEAQAYAAWRGGRLPTEAEWEYAARGPSSWIYPWGNDPDDTKANVGTGMIETIGNYEDGASWVGAYDMVGNVWEWVQDWYAAYTNRTNQEAVNDPQGPRFGEYPVIRGGSWFNYSDRPNEGRAALRWNKAPHDQLIEVGLRVVVDP